MGAGVVIPGARGLTTSGHVAWEPVKGRHIDSPDPFASS